MMTIENARITNTMLDEIKNWQDDDSLALQSDTVAIDNAIAFIACQHICPMENSAKEALNLIAELSFLKRKLYLFNGKEDKQ